MADESSFLIQLGIKMPDLIAGFAGGVTNAFVFKRTDTLSVTGSIVVGALTANYLSDIFARYLGTSPGASAFIVGLAGMAICQGILEAAKKWSPLSKGKPDGT